MSNDSDGFDIRLDYIFYFLGSTAVGFEYFDLQYKEFVVGAAEISFYVFLFFMYAVSMVLIAAILGHKSVKSTYRENERFSLKGFAFILLTLFIAMYLGFFVGNVLYCLFILVSSGMKLYYEYKG